MSKINNGKSFQNVIMKSDSTENWAKCENKYIPVINTILVYKDEDGHSRFKISDGIHKLKDLPFVNQTQSENLKPSVNENILSFK